jgi:hypothetical protein
MQDTQDTRTTPNRRGWALPPPAEPAPVVCPANDWTTLGPVVSAAQTGAERLPDDQLGFDVARAERVALDASTVYINDGKFNLSAPFGGTEQSGYGRERGR